jgi:hypothetical protein
VIAVNPLVYGLLLLGLLLVCLLAVYAFKRLSRGWSLKLLFKDFNRKMWMTICLGSLFFGIYLLIVSLGIYFVHEWGTDLFFIMYHHPIPFIYGALCLFACASLSIYLARMLIKYLYLTRGKDN